MPETTTPGSDRERSTGPIAQSERDAEMAARGLAWKSVPPADKPVVLPPLDDDLVEEFTAHRKVPGSVMVVAGAVAGLGVLGAIIYAVVTVSDESTRPVESPTPPNPTSVQLPAPQPTPTTPQLSPTLSAPVAPAPPLPGLPPITATAETVTTAPPPPILPPDPGLGVRDRLRELFPRLFPEGQ